MKLYKTKRELEAVINAVQESLDDKWSLGDKELGGEVRNLFCPLCAIIRSCFKDHCPLYLDNEDYPFKCGHEYNDFIKYPTPANFMAMRRKLQAIKRQLVKQLEVLNNGS